MPILTPEERLGERVANRYHLEAVLSSGGMGVLFRASDRATGEQVAVKMLKPAHSLNPGHVARFVREIRIASTVRHPNTARVIDVWSDDAGTPFLVMELLQGRSLAQELDQRLSLPFSEVLAIAIPIASALEAAHALGTVHRDIKPSNIFLCEDPNTGGVVPKLLDFGIAKGVQEDFETDTGFLIGTPGYMAPEHAQYGECCTSTDIWGLGAVIYSCLAGHPPHAGGSVHEMLGKLVREPVPPLEVAGVSKRASAIIDRALARDPQLRYPSIAAFRHALSALASDDPGVSDETATFQTVELARAGVLAEGTAQDPPDNEEPTSGATRGRRRVVAAACVAAALLLPLTFAPGGAQVETPDRSAPPNAARLASVPRVETAPVVEVSAESAVAATPLPVSTDAVASAGEFASSTPQASRVRAMARARKEGVASAKRGAPAHVADAPSKPVMGPNPMDRRH